MKEASASGLHAMWAERGFMARDLLLAIGIPVALLLLFSLLLERRGGKLPAWLGRLTRRPSLIWNGGIGLILGLSFLRRLLQR